MSYLFLGILVPLLPETLMPLVHLLLQIQSQQMVHCLHFQSGTSISCRATTRFLSYGLCNNSDHCWPYAQTQGFLHFQGGIS